MFPTPGEDSLHFAGSKSLIYGIIRGYHYEAWLGRYQVRV